MFLRFFPTYCGGQILTGLYDNRGQFKSEEIIKWAIHDRKKYLGDVSYQTDESRRVPDTLEDFQTILKHITGVTNYTIDPLATFRGLGTICAVTNSQQRKAREYLEATGFKCVAYTSKYNNEMSMCRFWLSDFFKDTLPILVKAKNYVENKPQQSAFKR